MKAKFNLWVITGLLGALLCLPMGDSHCVPLDPPPHGSFVFTIGDKKVRCTPDCAVGVTATLTCSAFYSPKETGAVAHCLPEGRWFPSSLSCVPVCGKSRSEVSLIVNGPLASPGTFPWHVALYNNIENSVEFWCSGSLVSERAVITAAHCTWNVRPENLTLGFGKYLRHINASEPNAQVIRAGSIKVLESYQDASGNYNGDISIIFLSEPVKLNIYVNPVCLDWDQTHMNEHLKEGSLGTVLGWGLTENETFSDHLRIIKIPVASDAKCIAEEESDFRKFVTYTSFCAGYRNGTGVCNGDSGGGLAFWDEGSSRWYLQGLVSVSPRRKGTPFCDPNYYTVFTKVSLFTRWFREIGVLDDGNSMKTNDAVKSKFPKYSPKSKSKTRDPYSFIRPYFKGFSKEVKGKRWSDFPHSKTMLEFLN